jgi:hypothetical protein
MVSAKTIRLNDITTARAAAHWKLIKNTYDEPTRRHSYVPTLAALSGGISPGP